MISNHDLLSTIECPKCGKNSVVKQGSVYFCINCRFRRNVADESIDSEMGSIFFAIFAVIIFLILI
jgi:uncharacterized Zn finger protein (UPF0148 family)